MMDDKSLTWAPFDWAGESDYNMDRMAEEDHDQDVRRAEAQEINWDDQMEAPDPEPHPEDAMAHIESRIVHHPEDPDPAMERRTVVEVDKQILQDGVERLERELDIRGWVENNDGVWEKTL